MKNVNREFLRNKCIQLIGTIFINSLSLLLLGHHRLWCVTQMCYYMIISLSRSEEKELTRWTKIHIELVGRVHQMMNHIFNAFDKQIDRWLIVALRTCPSVKKTIDRQKQANFLSCEVWDFCVDNVHVSSSDWPVANHKIPSWNFNGK